MKHNSIAGARLGMTPRAIAVNRQWAVSRLVILAWMRGAGIRCVLAVARRRQREALRGLDDRLLCDIGKTRREAETEAAKPFWQ